MPAPTVPGVGIALIWGLSSALTLRGHSGLPGMPSTGTEIPGWRWAVIAGVVGAGFAASVLVRRRPLAALFVLIVAAVALPLAVGTRGLAGSPESHLMFLLVAPEVMLGRIIAAGRRGLWPVAALPILVAVPVSAGLRVLLGQPDGHERVELRVDGEQITEWLGYTVMPVAVAVLAGYSVRQAREYARRLSEQAAGQAVIAERLRISRELHDHVAHSVGIIALQAGAASRVMDAHPEQAREAMRAVEATSRDTLAGLRRMVGGLREDGDQRSGPGEALPTRPLPGLAEVEELAATTTAAGVEVELRWSGERRVLPAEVELSAYRIIQESLTNVLRHAATGSCRVSVAYGAGDLAIEVTDDGTGGDASGGGFGLVGLRERVTLLGGTMTAGARPEGGFRVSVRLPAEPTAVSA